MVKGTLKHLEQDFENMFKNIEESHDGRVQWLYEKLNATREMMRQFQRENAQRAKQIRELLEGFQSSYQNMRKTLSEFQHRINPKKAKVQSILSAHSKQIPQFYVANRKKKTA